MRAAKAGACSYQQFQHCSTVGSTSCLVAVDVCLAILSCMGSWEMFQVLFIISQSTKLRIKEWRNSTGLAQPLENRWVTHSSVSNSAFGRGWTVYPSWSFFYIHFPLFLFKENCALPLPFLCWPSMSVLPKLLIIALLSKPNGHTVFVEILTAITSFWSFPVPKCLPPLVSLPWSLFSELWFPAILPGAFPRLNPDPHLSQVFAQPAPDLPHWHCCIHFLSDPSSCHSHTASPRFIFLLVPQVSLTLS